MMQTMNRQGSPIREYLSNAAILLAAAAIVAAVAGLLDWSGEALGGVLIAVWALIVALHPPMTRPRSGHGQPGAHR
jgi:hypothetical protein